MADTPSQTNLYFVSEREFAIGGHCKMIFANLKGSASYATGGDRLDTQVVGAGTKGKIACFVPTLTDSGTYIIYPRRIDINTVRLIFTVRATGAEVANATNLSAETFTAAIMFVP